MSKLVSAVMWLLGLCCLLIGLAHIAFGPVVIRGGMAVNATMDSEERFLATFFAAFGVACMWCTRDMEARKAVAAFLLKAFFAGGVARLISMAAVGRPDDFFVAMTAIELGLPVLLALLWNRSGQDPAGAKPAGRR